MNKVKIADKISILMLSLLILLYSTILQFSVQSVVLCFGDDGHIAFEQSEVGYPCVDSDEHGNHLIDSHENLSHQDGGCNDVSLINFSSNPYIGKECKLKNFKLSPVDIRLKTSNSINISPFNFLINPIIIHPTTESLRNTILLI